MPMGSYTGGRQIPDITPDALNRRIMAELEAFHSWLRVNNARGYIGEIGWPNGAETERWNNLAIRYYERLRVYNMEACTWASGEVLEENDNLRQYYSTSGTVIDTVSPTTIPSERHATVPGTNLVGAAWGRGTIGAGVFSNLNPGVVGVNYFYPSTADLLFLASRGIKTVRFSFRWERLQRALSGALDTGETDRILEVLTNAHAVGIKVILEPHNFGAYILGSNISTRQTLRITTNPAGALNTSHLTDLWAKMSTAFKGTRGLYAYNLMNEPAEMSSFGGDAAPQVWEAISQACVDAIRENNDPTLIMVPGYEYSRVAKWIANHPVGWITDSADNFMYEAHHYWDRSNGGQYPNSYDNNNASAGVQY